MTQDRVNHDIVTMTSWMPDLTSFAGPRYVAIAEALAADVQSGRLAPGARLPTHRGKRGGEPRPRGPASLLHAPLASLPPLARIIHRANNLNRKLRKGPQYSRPRRGLARASWVPRSIGALRRGWLATLSAVACRSGYQSGSGSSGSIRIVAGSSVASGTTRRAGRSRSP